MGYRSTMILGIAPKHKKEFDKLLKKYGDDLFDLVKEDDDMLVYEEDGVIHSEIGHHYDYVGTFTTHEIY